MTFSNIGYESRFGLEYDPFLKNSKETFVETSETKEVMTRLNTLAGTNGFGLLTGAPGRGKTTCIRKWSQSLNPSLYKVVYTSLSTLTVNDFYRNLVSNFGIQPNYRKPENFKLIQSEINRYVFEKKITPVIILDEANHIGPAILHDLKIIFNFEMDSKDRAVVLLAGLPVLNNTLSLNVHEALRQRFVMNYNIEGIPKAEGRLYIQKKLESAGATRNVFEDNAIETILNAADGTPRVIDRLCSSSLQIANALTLQTVNADTVTKAVSDIHLI